MLKVSTIILTFIALSIFIYKMNHSNIQHDIFQAWKAQYGYQFEHQQNQFRKTIFLNTFKEVNQFNSRKQRTYTKGINQFSHLTDQEFKLNFMSTTQQSKRTQLIEEPTTKLAEDIDWVLLGKVSRVKNQGNCDAGYAFSTTSLIESYTRIKSNNNTQFSEQQLVDCSTSYGTQGCQGGARTGALNYVKEKGISFESQYPFRGTVGTCRIDSGIFKYNSYGSVTGCDAIGNALRTSPVTIAADATNWRSYRSGIFSDCTGSVTHDVFLVGQTTTYWKIKNSWGLTWGQAGYIRIAPGNTCGICGINAYWITS